MVDEAADVIGTVVTGGRGAVVGAAGTVVVPGAVVVGPATSPGRADQSPPNRPPGRRRCRERGGRASPRPWFHPQILTERCDRDTTGPGVLK